MNVQFDHHVQCTIYFSIRDARKNNVDSTKTTNN